MLNEESCSLENAYTNRWPVSQVSISEITSRTPTQYESSLEPSHFQTLEVEMGALPISSPKTQSMASVVEGSQKCHLNTPNWLLVRPKSMNMLHVPEANGNLAKFRAQSVHEVYSSRVRQEVISVNETDTAPLSSNSREWDLHYTVNPVDMDCVDDNLQRTAHHRSMDDVLLQQHTEEIHCDNERPTDSPKISTSCEVDCDSVPQGSSGSVVDSELEHESLVISSSEDETLVDVQENIPTEDNSKMEEGIAESDLKLLEKVTTGPSNEQIKITVSFTIIEEESRKVQNITPVFGLTNNYSYKTKDYQGPEEDEDLPNYSSLFGSDQIPSNDVHPVSKVQIIKDIFLRKVAEGAEGGGPLERGRSRRQSTDVVARRWPELMDQDDRMLSASLPLLDLANSETDLVSNSEPALPQMDNSGGNLVRVYTGGEVFEELSHDSNSKSDWYSDVVTETLITQLDHHGHSIEQEAISSDSSEDDDVFVSPIKVSGLDASTNLLTANKGFTQHTHSGPIYLPSWDFPSLDLPQYPRYKLSTHRMSIIHEVDEDSDSILNRTI